MIIQKNSKNFKTALMAILLFTMSLFTACNDDVKAVSLEAVDLGLPSGTKWANMNVGAKSPADYGDYFAWGETKPKKEYTEKNCQTCGNSELGDIAGNSKYDAATANLGSKWKMPTSEQKEELSRECKSHLKSIKNSAGKVVRGYKLVGPNGNSIFFPAAGYRNGSVLIDARSVGCYWISTPNENNSDYAYSLSFGGSNCQTMLYNLSRRYDGLSVRPVLVE